MYYFIFTPKIGEDEPILTSIFFRWVGSTTKKMMFPPFLFGKTMGAYLGFCWAIFSRFVVSPQHVSPLRGRLVFFIKSFGKNLTTRYTLW